MSEVKPIAIGDRQGPDTAGSGPPTLGLGTPPRKNTHSAGAGRRPATLVGHDNELQDWSVALQRAENARSAKSVVAMAPVVRKGPLCWGSFSAEPKTATG